MAEGKETHWSLDRRVPLALVVTIVVQTVVFAFWLGTVSARLTSVEATVDRFSANSDRLTRLEVQLENIRDTVERIDKRMENLR